MDTMTDTRPRQRRGELTGELAARILEYVAARQIEPGTHIPTQDLADHFSVSRSPVNQALKLLSEKGVVRHEPNRGYFLDQAGPVSPEQIGLSSQSDLTRVYFRMAEDRLTGALPDQVSEVSLRQRYGLTRSQLADLLNRVSREGWAERRPGYGWNFSPILRTTRALEQTYRLRMAIEPGALTEPTFRLERATLERLAAVERRLLAGAIETMSADGLYERGVQYHEALAEASGNPFFLDTLRRVNQVRRLLAYRSMIDRRRYYSQAREHLAILDLLREDRNEDAALLMRRHLEGVVRNHQKIRAILET